MAKWWKRLWCLHYWIETLNTDSLRHPFKESTEYKCIKCGKKKFFTEPPISYTE